MTDDTTLNWYLNELQSIIDEINSIKDAISQNITGLGEEKSVSSLDFIATCYTNIKNNVVNNYYLDKNNN